MTNSTLEQLINDNSYVVYRNVGSSMMPLIRQNKDLLVIRKKTSERLKKGDIPLYKRENNYVLHRIIKVTKTGYICCGDNRYSREYDVVDDMIIGVLSEIVRNGEVVDFNSFKYKAYSFAMTDLFPLKAAIVFVKIKMKRLLRLLKND